MEVVVSCFLGANFVRIVQVVVLGSEHALVWMGDVVSCFLEIYFVVIVVLTVLGSVYFLGVKSCFLGVIFLVVIVVFLECFHI